MTTFTDPLVPADDLEMAMVYSVLDDFPIFATFQHQGTIQPFVFIRGAPIPYRVFVLLLAERMHGPKAVQSYVDRDGKLLEQINAAIKPLWDSVTLPAEVKNTINERDLDVYFKEEFDNRSRAREFLVAVAASKLVRNSYTRFVKDEKTLRAYIKKLEERYAASLDSPLIVQ